MKFSTLTTYDPNQFQDDNFDIVQAAWSMIRRSVPSGDPSERLQQMQTGRVVLYWRSQEEVDEFIRDSEAVGRGLVKSVQINEE